METQTAQADTYGALVLRGYTHDLEPDQLVARQVCKLLEEACETALCVKGFSPYAERIIQRLHEIVRGEFDERDRWQEQGGIKDMAKLREELADDYVTIANAAESSQWVDGKFFDVALAGRAKATADIVRGVRRA